MVFNCFKLELMQIILNVIIYIFLNHIECNNFTYHRGAGAVAVAGASAERGCFKSPWVRGRLALPQEPPIFAQAISLPSIWVSLSDGVLHSSPARDVVG